MMTYGESPMAEKVAADLRSKIIHARMLIGDRALMGSDAPPDQYAKPQGFSVSLTMKDPAEADRIFNELGQSGNVTMPIQKTFWSVRFAMLTDRFGIPWMINGEQAA
jgi:PhnB protein